MSTDTEADAGTDSQASSATSLRDVRSAVRDAVEQRSTVTGDEMEGRFDAWWSRRREHRQLRKQSKEGRSRGRMILTGALSLCLAGVAVTYGLNADRFASKRAAQTHELSQARASLAQSKAVVPHKPSGNDLLTLVTSATKAGNTVAAGQQRYAELYRTLTTSKQTAVVETPAMAATAKHCSNLTGFFASTAKVHSEAADCSWYQASASTPDGTIDPRFPWYVRYENNDQASPAKTYQWTLVSAQPEAGSIDASGSSNTAHVIWVCQQTADKTVLAWASADYSPGPAGAQGLFRHLQLVTTSNGSVHAQPVAAKSRDTTKPPGYKDDSKSSKGAK